MRTPALLSMMVLAMAPAALAQTVPPPAESCTLKIPLKATRPGGVSTWETLAPGTALSMVSRKSDWSRVRHGDTIHIVATSQFTHACVAADAKTETSTSTSTSTSTAATAAPKSETKTEPASTTTTTAAEAKTETKTDAAKAEAVAATTTTTTAAAAAAAPAAEAKSEAARTDVVAASATTKTETTDAKKAKTSPLPSQPSSGQLFVLGLLLLGAVFTGVFFRRRAVVEQSHLDVVATRTLGRGKQLVIVNAGDARLLLGVTDQGITLLSSTPSSESSSSPSPRSSSDPPRTRLSLLTEEEEAATSSPAASFFSGVGKKVGSLWGRPPAGPSADWDNFDRILASTVPDSSVGDASPSNSRRSSERSSPGGGAADLAELARQMQKHGVRRSA
jgi:flagellar biogenesis protein FliO